MEQGEKYEIGLSPTYILFHDDLMNIVTGHPTRVSLGEGTRRLARSSSESCLELSQRSQESGFKITGMRSWIDPMSELGVVVIRQADMPLPPSDS